MTQFSFCYDRPQCILYLMPVEGGYEEHFPGCQDRLLAGEFRVIGEEGKLGGVHTVQVHSALDRLAVGSWHSGSLLNLM